MRNSPFIRITLDPPSSAHLIYSNGSVIKGFVDVASHSGLLLSEVSISLKGRITTRIDTGSGESRRSHHQKVYLFSTSKILHNGGALVREATTWSFEFQFPDTVQPCVQRADIIPGPGWEHLPGHDLPPSWESSSGWSKISYYLEVFAYDTSAVIRNEIKNRVFLQFSPSRPIQSPPLVTAYTRKIPQLLESRKLDPEYGTQQLSFREKTKKVFSSSEPKPKLYFTITSSIPTQTHPGAILPLKIGIQHDPVRSTAPAIPSIYLQNLHVRLTNTHTTRVQVRGFTRMKNLTKTYSKKIPIVHRGFTNLVMDEDMNLAELLPSALLRMPEDLAPSFVSYTVRGEYIVKVTAVVRCIDKLFEVEVGKVGIDILPKTFREAEGISTAVSSSLTPNSILHSRTTTTTTQLIPSHGAASAEVVVEQEEEEDLPPYATQDPNRRSTSSRAGPPVVF